MLYVVTGATGNTGSIVAAELMKAGKKVRVIGREKAKLEKFPGAEIVEGSVTDAEMMKRAFQGATAAYVMIPPNFATQNFRKYQDEVTDSLTDALASNGVSYAVTLSSVGANHASGVGPINGLYYMEQQLDAIPDLNTLHLRAGFFMENIFGSLSLIKKMGIYGSATPPEYGWPLVATRDIGAYAARRLSALDLKGKAHQYLLGPREVTGPEAAQILGKAFDMENLPYIQFSIADMKKGMTDAGMSEGMAALYCELYEGASKGLLDYSRDAESNTPTSFEWFTENLLAPAFKAMPA